MAHENAQMAEKRRAKLEDKQGFRTLVANLGVHTLRRAGLLKWSSDIKQVASTMGGKVYDTEGRIFDTRLVPPVCPSGACLVLRLTNGRANAACPLAASWPPIGSSGLVDIGGQSEANRCVSSAGSNLMKTSVLAAPPTDSSTQEPQSE